MRRAIYLFMLSAGLLLIGTALHAQTSYLRFNTTYNPSSNPTGPIVVGQEITLQVVAFDVPSYTWAYNIPITLTGDGLAGELNQTTGSSGRAVMGVYFTTPGSKTVTATATSYTNDTYTVTVNKGNPADVEFTIPTGHIYNGSPQGIGSITQTANGITGFGAVTVYYDGSTTPPTNAGTYTVTADFAGGENFNAATNVSLGDYTINPKDITVTALGGSSTFGESPTNPGFSAAGLVNNETESVLAGLSTDFNITPTTLGGSYTLNVTGVLTNDNYNITQRNTGTWVVNQQTPPSPSFTVNMTADEGIILLPSPGVHAVSVGGSFTFYITLSEGYEGQIPTVLVNGDPVNIQLRPNGYEWMYTIPMVYDDTRVHATFQTTGNDTPDGPRLYSRDGRLFIETATPISLTVYSIAGQALVNRRITEGLTAIPLPNGVYIIKMDQEVRKISVRE